MDSFLDETVMRIQHCEKTASCEFRFGFRILIDNIFNVFEWFSCELIMKKQSE